MVTPKLPSSLDPASTILRGPMNAITLLKCHNISSLTVSSRSNGQQPPPFSRLSQPASLRCWPTGDIGSPFLTGPGPLRPRPPPLRPEASPPMASRGSAPLPGNLTELTDVADFDALATPDGLLSIAGFGSLLSEKSARSTFPDLKDFRLAVLRGFRRVFAHVAPIFFERGIAKAETGEVSSLSVEPCEEEFVVVTVFEIRKEEVPAFMEREHEFRFLAVVPEGLDGTPTSPAVVCACYSDEEYFQIRCKGSREIFYKQYGRYNIDKIWRDDILPCRVYLRHCVLAAKSLGEVAYSNFLDHTYLSDRKTTIREYLASAGSGIMEEEPPESLRSRYGG